MKSLKGLILVMAMGIFPAAMAQSTYLMGAGDEVRMTVYSQPELTTDAQINTDGTLEVPLIGSVKVAGRSSGDAAVVLRLRAIAAPVPLPGRLGRARLPDHRHAARNRRYRPDPGTVVAERGTHRRGDGDDAAAGSDA